MTRRNRSRRVLDWVLMVGFLAAMLALLSSDFRSTEAALTEGDVGTIATKNYRATKDFTFSRTDEEATATARAQKAAEVPPVYRWEADIATSARRRIREAFAYMRDSIESVRLDTLASMTDLLPPPTPPSPSPRITDPGFAFAYGAQIGVGIGVFPLVAIDDTPEPVEKEEDEQANAEKAVKAAVDSWVDDHQEEFEERLGLAVDDADYALLASQRFSKKSERQLLGLVDAILQRQLVRDSSRLQSRVARGTDDVADGEGPEQQRPLIVVYRRENAEDDDELVPVYTLSAVLDLPDARRAIADEAEDRLSTLQPRVRAVLTSLAREFVEPNLFYDAEMTQEAREEARGNVRDLVVQEEFKQGQIIVDEGHVITAEHLEIYRQMVGESPETTKLVSGVVGLGVFLVLLLLAVGLLLRGNLDRRRRARRDVIFLCVSLLVMTLVLRLGDAVLTTVAEAWQWNISDLVVLMLPFAAGSMMLRLTLGGEIAVVFGVVVAVIAGLVVELPVVIVPYALITGIVGAVALRRTKTRMMVLTAGLVVGLTSAVCAVGLVMFELQETSLLSLAAVAGLAVTSGALAAITVTATLPIIETVFGYTTDIKLLELANLEHKALKDLILKAPGTYHHSMMVGSLNEAAAEAIGANALLARVGAYYHDIGKMKNAQYFAENQQGENPHAKLKPNMSALILKAHVKDGIEMARTYKLPQDIIDFIATHHGTSRIEYFYHKAKELESPDIPEVREEDYRYPGPRPQSRETGICMIADTVEAAARSLPEKTPARLKMLVHKLINHKFADGQFDECDLTLRDLNMIAEAMLRILTAVYHHRPKYPDKKGGKDDSSGAEEPATPPDDEPDPLESLERIKIDQVGTSAAIERAVEVARAAMKERKEDGSNGKPDVEPETQSLASRVMQRAGVPDSLILGPDPDAPVGRERTDRSGSGEHKKVDVNATAEVGSADEG